MKKIIVACILQRFDQYVPICLNSILAQTYQNIEFHIICNSDSKTLIKAYFYENFNNIKNVKFIKATECGSNIIQGYFYDLEYFRYTDECYFFNIDGDDYLEPDCLEKLVKAIEETDCDIACCGVAKYHEKTNKLENHYILNKIKVIHRNDYAKLLNFYDRLMETFWGKLFRSNLFELVDFSEIPDGSLRGGISGDTMMSYAMLEKTNKFVITEGVGYYYRVWDVSVSNKFLPNREKANAYMHKAYLKFLYSLSPQISQENYRFIVCASYWAIYNAIETLIKSDLNNNEKFDKFHYMITEEVSKKTLPYADEFMLKYMLAIYINFLKMFVENQKSIDVNPQIEQQSLEIFSMLFIYTKGKYNEFKIALYLLIKLVTIDNVNKIKEILQFIAPKTCCVVTPVTFDMIKKDGGILKKLIENDSNSITNMLVPKLKFDTLKDEIFVILKQLVDTDNLINTIDNPKFLLRYKKITENLLYLKLEETFDTMTDTIMQGKKVDMFEEYINLYINLSYKLAIELGVLVGKLKLAQFLYDNNNIQDSLIITKELVEVGFVSDELDDLVSNLTNHE